MSSARSSARTAVKKSATACAAETAYCRRGNANATVMTGSSGTTKKRTDTNVKDAWIFISSDRDFDYPRICREAHELGIELLCVERGNSRWVACTDAYVKRLIHLTKVNGHDGVWWDRSPFYFPMGLSGSICRRNGPLSKTEQACVMLYPNRLGGPGTADLGKLHRKLLQAEAAMTPTLVTGY